DESLRLRFRREAEVAARLDHPTLCKVLAFGFERGVPYLVMPFIEGRPLSEVIAASDSGPAELLSPASGVSSTRTAPAFVAAAARLVERLARGLHVAHELGVVHRDVKPGNILLTPDGDPVLLDFGLARDDEAVQHQLTHSHDVLGTPAYMSPEQVRGERSDRRADVFALAVVLYELLAGERPFRGASRRELFDAITRGAWQPLQRVRAGTPRDLDLVLSVALETEPDRRYETALAFADDLSRVIARQPVLARPVGPIGRLARWCQRNRLLAASVATVITTLAITGGISTAAWQRSEEARAEAEAIHDYILGDLLAAARPRGLGRAARIVDTLEHAAAEVDARFADRPALGATVRLRLATTFRSLGLWQQALDLAEKSHEVRRAIFGDGSAEALRARLEIATAQLQLTRWEAVLRTLAEEGAFEATFGSESPEALRAGVVLAAARARINGAEDLLPRIRALHAAAVRTCGGGSETAMLTATALFDTLTGLNRYEDCVAFARTHSELMRHSHGVDSAEAAEAALDLGTALIRANFPRQALEATSALLDRLRASHGPEHPLVAVAHGTIANSLAQLDRSDESIEHYLEAYRIFAAGLGPEHPHTLVAQNDLAIGYRIAGRLDLAHQHAMAALESRRRVLGEQSPGVASSLSALSAIAMSREDFAGAADFAQRAIDMVEASPGMGGPDLAGLYWNLARCLASTEQFVRAAEVWTRILEMDRKTGGPDSPWVAADQRRYGRILYLCGRLDEAADACDDA
ncbi:MAG: serine/threonine protein kinase, partial [Planctomycetes bacterium]|nr:serine/threonine protein kinase [Planctomycetota bacterium]